MEFNIDSERISVGSDTLIDKKYLSNWIKNFSIIERYAENGMNYNIEFWLITYQ